MPHWVIGIVAIGVLGGIFVIGWVILMSFTGFDG